MTRPTRISGALIRLRDQITQSLPESTASEWSDRFDRVVTFGVDLSPVIPRFLRWILSVDGPMGEGADMDETSTVRSLFDRVLNGEKIPLSEWRTAKKAAQYASANVCLDGTRFPEMDATEFAAMRNAARAAEEAAEISMSEAFNDSCFARWRGAEAAIAAKEAVGKAEAAIQADEAAMKAAEAEWEADDESEGGKEEVEVHQLDVTGNEGSDKAASEEEMIKGWKAVANFWRAYYLRIDGESLEKEAWIDPAAPDTDEGPDHGWADEESTSPDPFYNWDGENPPLESDEVSVDDVYGDPFREATDAEVAARAADIRAHREARRYAESAAIAAKSAKRAPAATEANWIFIADHLLEIITECSADKGASRYPPTTND